ncbi:MAG: lysylphosphatidylglycerol synthase transmembrane domain-containing protein [Bacillota bacterium]
MTGEPKTPAVDRDSGLRARLHALKPPAAQRHGLRKLLRLLVSAALIGGLVYLGRKYRVGEVLAHTDPLYVGLGIAAYMLGQLTAAKRWHTLLLMSGFRPRFLPVLRANTVGMYASNFLPGVAGGDVVRPIILYGAATVHKPQLYASVVFERLCGIGSIAFLACAGAVWRGLNFGDWRFMIVAAVIVGAILAGLWLVHLARHAPLAGESRLARFLRGLKEGSGHLIRYALSPKSVVIGLVYSLVFQLCYIAMFWCFLTSLGARTSVFSVVLAAPLAWLASMTPVSLNGLGVREGTLVVVLTGMGVPQAEVTGAALMGLVPLFLISAVGAVWSLRMFSGGPVEPPPPAGG